MKELFMGGTGIISMSSSRLAVERGMDLFLLNRGTRLVGIPEAKCLKGDVSRVDDLAWPSLRRWATSARSHTAASFRRRPTAFWSPGGHLRDAHGNGAMQIEATRMNTGQAAFITGGLAAMVAR